MAAPLYTKVAIYDSGKADYWDNVTMESGTVRKPVDPGNLRGSLCSVLFSRSEPVGIREDYAMIDFHFSVNAGLDVFTTLEDADAAVVETALDTMWTALKANCTAHIILAGYVWRHWGADYPLGKTGLSKPSPTWRTTARSVAGTVVSACLPDQVARSVTFKTPSRRHWGRVYLPPCSTGGVTTEGRQTSAYVDTAAGAVHTMLNDLNDNVRQIDTLVWSPKYRGAFGISSIQMDDVFDVIRSRRAKMKTYAKVYTS